MKRVLFSVVCVAVVSAVSAGADQGNAALRYERALEPGGVMPRLNRMSGRTEKPVFVLHAQTALPGSERTVVVYSEKMPSELPFETMHSVYAAVLEGRGEELRVLDRRELTEDVPLYVGEPGNVFELQALVTPLAAPGIVAVELWASLHGTASYNAASDLFFSVDEAGKLVRVLTVKDAYAGANVDANTRSAETTRILVGTGPSTSNEIVLERRTVNWVASELSPAGRPQCGPAQVSSYRFDGRTFESAPSTPRATTAGYSALRRLPFLENIPCN